MITVFYDGQCGLCLKEINHYKKIAPPNIFEWKDITLSANFLLSENISRTESLKRLHAKDAKGKLHTGIDAFILIWCQLKCWKVMALIIRLPVIYHFAGWLYEKFADWRFKRLKHCAFEDKG